jgi:hypothetical protein
MMKLLSPVIVGALVVAAASPAIAQQPKVQGAETFASAPGRGEVARVIRVSATVTAIDKATRFGPSVILMAGARSESEQLHYPASELAARYGASAKEDTIDPRQAYGPFARPEPGRPPYWQELPWS